MTVKNLFFLLIATFLLTCSPKETKKDIPVISVVPLPVVLEPAEGTYQFGDSISIAAQSDDERNAALFLVEYLTLLNHRAKIITNDSPNADITLRSYVSKEILPDGYNNIVIDKEGVDIFSTSASGLFYGAQTLIQLLNQDSNALSVPYLRITDFPRFQWRGLHLDVCRHFFPVDFIKRYIDLMSRYKFNTFHWHLTEDQGWRIEIKKYPLLQEVAAYRNETLIGHYSKQPHQFDGQRYGGYYTQEEIREVVNYAAKRHITIVPEIEMPGHSLAALAAYPYLGCSNGPYESATKWGVFEDVYCAGKESTFTFLENVLAEVIELFPGEYIHIGGDECPKIRWEKCNHCQKRIKSEDLKDEHELQSYFIKRIEKYLNAKGKKLIGWDEILEGGLAPNAAVMSWRGEEGGIAAAKSGHSVVMSPGFALYFDHYQGPPEAEPVAIGGNTPLRKVYDYEPHPKDLTEDESSFVLGAQANVWTEYIKTTDHVEYMVYPRALALAEVVWSPKESRNWNNFTGRLTHQLRLLNALNVNYRKPTEDELK